MTTLLALLWALLLPAHQPAQPPAKPDAKSKASEPTTLAATITLRDVDLAELVEKLKLELGYKLAGKVTVVASIAVPLGEATTAASYKLDGKVTSPEVVLEGLRVQDVAATLKYADGKLNLTDLKASLPPDVPTDKLGTLSGTATAAITPRGDLKANLKLTRVPLGQALKAVPGGVPASGPVSGNAEFQAPLDKLSDMSTWVGSADLSADAVTVYERNARNAKAKLAVKGGKVTVSSLSADVESIPVTADGSLTLSGKYPFTAAVRTQPQQVSELQKLVPELELPVAVKGKLSADATFDGALNPFSISASGTVAATDFGFGDVTGDTLSAKWKLTPERVTVSDLKAGVFKGSVSGLIDYPLVPEATGEVNVKFQKVDAAAVAAAFPKLPVKLTGEVSGDVTGKLPAAKPGEERPIAADVNLTAPRLTVQGIPAEKLTGKLSVEGSALKYALEGKTLGGSFDVKGTYPAAKTDAPPPANKDPKKDDGQVHLRAIDLGKLADALRLTNFPLRGIVDLHFVYAADLSTGEGWYSARGLGFGRDLLIPEISGRLRMRNGNLELVDTVGPISRGTIRAQVRASLTDPARNFYRLSLDQMELSRLFGAFGQSRSPIEGVVSISARGKLWPEFTATGSVGLTRGRLSGVTVTELRVPYTLSVRGGNGQLKVHDAAGVIGSGRLSGQFEYAWGTAGRATGQVKFTSVRLGSVLTDLKQANYFGGARATGRIDLKGENIQSVDDLTAAVNATLAGAAVRDLPVLSAVTPFIPPTAVLQPFDTGEFRARLSRGVFRIEKLTLSSSTTDLYADGTVTTSGRLDLGVIVRTGNLGLNDALLSQLGVSLPLPIAPLPLEVIRDVSAFLSNRTVRLTVTGTLANPQPQVNTSALIADEAIRFLLRRYAPAAAAILPEVSPRSTR